MPRAGVRGDFARLVKLRGRIAQLARGDIAAEMSERLSDTAVDLVKESIRQSEGPYGEQWPATTEGKAPFASAAGDISAQHTAKGFVLKVPVPYWRSGPGRMSHETGMHIKAKPGRFLAFEIGGGKVFAKEVHVPARQIAPSPSRGMGDKWRERLHAAANELMRERMGT